MNRFVVTESKKIIDTTKCLSASLNDFVICYRKNKFVPQQEEKVLYTANTVSEIAILVLQGKIDGAVFTTKGHVSIGAYPAELIHEIGRDKIITSIWVKTAPHVMACWWDRKLGVLR